MNDTDTANSIVLPLLLSCLAGGSTCLGAAVVFCFKTISSSQLAFALSLAGSVMVTVSLYSILPECFQSNGQYLTISDVQFWHRCLGFCLGSLLYACFAKCAFPEPKEIVFSSEAADDDSDNMIMKITSTSAEIDSVDSNDDNDETEQLLIHTPPLQITTTTTTSPTSTTTPQQRLITTKRSLPSPNNDNYNKQHKHSFWHGTDLTTAHAKRAWRVALVLFVSLLVHNFPEGLAVAASTMHSPQLGITTTIAIALHNIPEGIAVAVPCLAARPNAPWLAFALASASGLAEPFGAAVALAWLPRGSWMKNVLAFVAGIMIMVAWRELFPEAWRHVQHQTKKTPVIWGALSGVFIMIGSEAVLERAA